MLFLNFFCETFPLQNLCVLNFKPKVPGICSKDLHLYLCTLREKSPFASPARMGTKKAFKMIYCKWFSTLLAKIISPAAGSLF